MHRIRVAPGKYSVQEISEEVEENCSILYLDDDYFTTP